MPEGAAEEVLRAVLARFDSLTAILVSTSEGVPLLKVEQVNDTELSLDDAETVLPSVFAAAEEQAGKLQFGTMNSITCFYESMVLIHINYLPLVITLIAQNTAKVGALLDLSDELKATLLPLKKATEATEGH